MDESMNPPPSKDWRNDSDAALTLGLLAEIEADASQTQRSFAMRLGVALGLVNAYLKRCARKGLIKIEQVPSRRYAYYLTRKGFAEKSRLVADYLTHSLGFFRQARAEYCTIFETCHRAPHPRIVIAGTGEMAEIALLSAREVGVEIEGVYARGANIKAFHGIPVLSDPAQIRGCTVVLADSSAPQACYDAIVEDAGPVLVFAPPLMRLQTGRQEDGGGQVLR